MNAQDLISQIAKSAGVDAETVESMAKMVCDRIEKWDVQPTQEIIDCAVQDSTKSYKKMTICALTRMHDFAPAIVHKAAH